jgi:hypothetical protein
MAQYVNKANQLLGERTNATDLVFDKTIIAGDPLTATQSGIFGFSYHVNAFQASGVTETLVVTQLSVTPSGNATQLLLRSLARDEITGDVTASLHNVGEVYLNVGDTVGVRAYADAIPSGTAILAERSLCNLTLRKL